MPLDRILRNLIIWQRADGPPVPLREQTVERARERYLASAVRPAGEDGDAAATRVLSYAQYFGWLGMGVGIATAFIAMGLGGLRNAVLPRWFAVTTTVMGVLALLALFTHNHIFWIAALLVALGLAGFVLLGVRRGWWDLVALAAPIVLVTVVGAASLAAPRRNEVLMTLVFPLAALTLSRGVAAISSGREWSPEQASSPPN